MPRPPSQYPTELELEILKIIWRDGPQTARQVRETLAMTRRLAMTTVVTVLNKMVAKGQLEREQRSKSAGGNLYSAVITQRKTAERVLADLKHRMFGGSAADVVRHLLDANEIDHEELARVKQVIESREREMAR
jgi:predicted transcriptional regulator